VDLSRKQLPGDKTSVVSEAGRQQVSIMTHAVFPLSKLMGKVVGWVDRASDARCAVCVSEGMAT